MPKMESEHVAKKGYAACEEDPLLKGADKAPPTSNGRLLLMTIFNFPISVIWSTMGLILLPYEALRLFPTDESMYLGIFLVIVGVSQLVCPVAGLMSDRYRSKYGRRRPFILWGTLVAFFGVIILAYGSIYMQPWAFMSGLFFAMTALNAVSTVQSAIVPDVCNDRKGEASGIVAGLSQGGNLFGMLWIMGSHGIDFHWSYLLYCVLMALCGVAVVLSFNDKPTDRDDDLPPITAQDLLYCYWLDSQGESDFFWVFVGRTFYYMSVSMQSFLFYYMRDLMLVDDEVEIRWRLAILVIIAMCFAIVVALPLGKYSEKVGRLKLIYASCVTMALVYAGYILAPYAGPNYGMWIVYGLAGVYGVGTGAFLAVDYALALDCLPKGKRGSAESLGIWGISGFLGSATGPLLGGGLLEMLGGWGEGGHYKYAGYIGLLGLASVCCLLSALSMRFVKGVQ